MRERQTSSPQKKMLAYTALSLTVGLGGVLYGYVANKQVWNDYRSTVKAIYTDLHSTLDARYNDLTTTLAESSTKRAVIYKDYFSTSDSLSTDRAVIYKDLFSTLNALSTARVSIFAAMNSETHATLAAIGTNTYETIVAPTLTPTPTGTDLNHK